MTEYQETFNENFNNLKREFNEFKEYLNNRMDAQSEKLEMIKKMVETMKQDEIRKRSAQY